MKVDERVTGISLNINKDKKYRTRILALIKSEKKGKRVCSADVIRNALDGVLKYNADDIDAYIEKLNKEARKV